MFPSFTIRLPRVLAMLALALCSFPLEAAETPAAAGSLRVLTFNAWHDWTKVDDGFAKAKSAIEAAHADLVGLQESSPATAQRMADALGWHRAQVGSGSVQILSRHPILETFTSDGLADDRFVAARVRVEQQPPWEVIFCNTHLDYEHYGPYAARLPGATTESILAENAQSERAAQIAAALATMEPWIANAAAIPVILVGDFNAPSHLDWTSEAIAAHGKVAPVVWPESKLVEDAGLRDSFRVAQPDPAAMPGDTWSTTHKESEPQDRIDFIYFAGAALHVADSRLHAPSVETTIGEWGGDDAAVRGNTWPSDHFAVLTTFSWEGGVEADDLSSLGARDSSKRK